MPNDYSTKPLHAADKAKRCEDEKGNIMNNEYKTNAGLEDVAVSYGLTVAGELSGYFQQVLMTRYSCSTAKAALSMILGTTKVYLTLTLMVSPAVTACFISNQLPVI